jgi:hypothetical protein
LTPGCHAYPFKGSPPPGCSGAGNPGTTCGGRRLDLHPEVHLWLLVAGALIALLLLARSCRYFV